MLRGAAAPRTPSVVGVAVLYGDLYMARLSGRERERGQLSGREKEKGRLSGRERKSVLRVRVHVERGRLSGRERERGQLSGREKEKGRLSGRERKSVLRVRVHVERGRLSGREGERGRLAVFSVFFKDCGALDAVGDFTQHVKPAIQ